MANCVDTKINEIINDHVAESEKASVSRNVDETARRIKEALCDFSSLEILASDHWGGLYYEAKIMALRDAVLEMAKGAEKPAKGVAVVDDAGVVSIEPVEAAPKKSRKAKAAA